MGAVVLGSGIQKALRMAWQISAWSSETGEGSIRSSHFGPVPFGPEENDWQVKDFAVGEVVDARVRGAPDALIVMRVRPLCPRDPEGTRAPEFAELNARFAPDIFEQEYDAAERTLRLVIGECCAWCSTPSTIVFSGVRYVGDWDEDVDFEVMRFRRATKVESQPAGPLTPAEVAYAIVVAEAEEFRSIVVVAEQVRIDRLSAAESQSPRPQ
jgi:hypothetical protein